MIGRYWSELGRVDVSALAAVIPAVAWPPVKGGQPNRVRALPEAESIIHEVMGWFGPGFDYDRYYACLSRLVPGATYELHRDPQRPNWLTRVHVPVVTNPLAWLYFADEGQRVHFEAGRAYSFNTLESHNYGNDGDADRVHLLFDVFTS